MSKSTKNGSDQSITTATGLSERQVNHIPPSKSSESVASTQILSPDTRDATKEEIETLQHAVDRVPTAVWIVALVGAAERFASYAITTPWRKFPITPTPIFLRLSKRETHSRFTPGRKLPPKQKTPQPGG